MLLSAHATILKTKEKDIVYSYQDFVGNSYIRSLINTLNSKNSLLEVETLEGEKGKIPIINDLKIIYAHNVNLIDNKQEKEIKQILEDNNYSFYAKINIFYSIWQQKVKGKITIFNDKDKIFEYRINKQSKEIILDKYSPYALTDKESFFYLPAHKKKTHAGSIIGIFENMAKESGNDIIKILKRKKEK